MSNFETKPHGSLAGRNSTGGHYVETHRVSTLTCSGCKKGTLAVTNNLGVGIHWYPAPGMGILDKQVNEGVASAFNEGMRCLSIGANRAAAVMFRSGLSLYVADKGSDAAKAKNRHLKNALTQMKEDGDLHKTLWDWADHLNQLGNEGAHPEDYDDVTAEEADALAKFVRHLIKHEYEMPAQLLRSRGLLKDEEPDETSPPYRSAATLPAGIPPPARRLTNPGDPQGRS